MWAVAHKEPEHNLLDAPVAISCFNAEPNAKLPSLAVAAGSHVYIYRNLRPYYKFMLPPEEVNDEEQLCWSVKALNEASFCNLFGVALCGVCVCVCA